jgi:translation elongation factor EF-Tu-like GTPase
MDSMDLERERGITIKAKNASVVYKGIKVNIVDTPGHADFGGEVERTLRMVDGILLVVDAKDGPMPQTRFVLKKALELGHKVIVVVNKIDRPDSQIDDVVNRTFDLFCELGASEEQLDFPIVYASALKGFATMDYHKPKETIDALMDTILEKIPAPKARQEDTLQILILALSQDSYKGKMGIGKISGGILKKGSNALLVSPDGSKQNSKVTSILVYEGLERTETDSAVAGDMSPKHRADIDRVLSDFGVLCGPATTRELTPQIFDRYFALRREGLPRRRQPLKSGAHRDLPLRTPRPDSLAKEYAILHSMCEWGRRRGHLRRRVGGAANVPVVAARVTAIVAFGDHLRVERSAVVGK